MKKFLPYIIIVVIVAIAGIFFYQNSKENIGQPSVVQSHRSYDMEVTSNIKNIKSSEPTIISYKIKNDKGDTLKDFEIVHEKIMHFIVVRKDLQEFQHLHPEFNQATGEFSVSIKFPSDGPYRIFPDFTPAKIAGNPQLLPVTVFSDIKVGNLATYQPQLIGTTEKTKIFQGYQITMISGASSITSGNSRGFDFEIKKDGILVTDLEKYLGALGHTVVLHEGDLQFIHAHATQEPSDVQTGKVNFSITFPEAGNYKLFSQFQHEGKIITSDFVVSVAEGKGNGSETKENGGSSIMH